jgi:SAM-dependent methyltransferase
MDVHRAGIEWCRNNISRKYPHFQFLHMDIQNGAYNPEGRVQAGAVAFPLRDGSVDFLAAISLFSSMFPLDVPHYIEEMSRVLKPGGRLFLSLFLLDEKSRHALDSGRASVPFATPVAGGLTAFPDRPEAAVACEGAFVLDELKSHRLALEGGIHHGRWRGGPGSSLTHEDVLVAVRLSDRLIQ